MSEKKKVTLNELKTVDPTDMAPKKKKAPKTPTTLDTAFEKIQNELLPRVKAEAEAEVVSKQEKAIEEEMEKEIETDDIELEEKEETVENTTEDEVSIGYDPNAIEDLDYDDFGLDDEDVKEDENGIEKMSDEEAFKGFQQDINNKIIPFKKVDLRTLTESKEVVSVTSVLRSAEVHKTADWVLYSANKPFTIKEFEGFDIQNLMSDESSNTINNYKRIYTTIYKNFVDVNKYATVEEWAKSVKFMDEKHIYFGIYLACFGNCNVVPFSCAKCGNIFTEDIPWEELVRYKNDEVKAKVQEMLQQDTTSDGEPMVYLEQISDDLIVAVKEPTIYNVVFENVILEPNFRKKYGNILSMATYIDGFYRINNDGTFSYIEYKKYPNNIVKTTKSKIQYVYKLIKTLNSDQYSYFNSIINNLNLRENDITYGYPEVECPKCGEKIPAQTLEARDMLFTRHQLTLIGNTTNN